MSDSKPSLIAITGPTASGKSRLALELAQRIGAEIISADSVQVFAGADIGSAKSSPEEMALVPHHLVSVLNPGEAFSAGKFLQLATSSIKDVHARGKLALISGGTGLYLRSLLGGLVPTAEITDEAIAEVQAREEAAEAACESKTEATKMLHAWLSEIDASTAAGLHRHDRVRICRALLVARSGDSLSDLQAAHQHRDRPFRALVCSILPDRDSLYETINRRVEQMLEAGLLEEVDALRERWGRECALFSTIGYRHALSELDGRMSREAMLEDMKRDTRRFAKRQYTWWRNQPRGLNWTQVQLDFSQDQFVNNKSFENILSGLERMVSTFQRKDSPFQEDGIFYCPIEGVSFF